MDILRNKLKYRSLPTSDQITSLIRAFGEQGGEEGSEGMWKAYLLYGYYELPVDVAVHSDLVAGGLCKKLTDSVFLWNWD